MAMIPNKTILSTGMDMGSKYMSIASGLSARQPNGTPSPSEGLLASMGVNLPKKATTPVVNTSDTSIDNMNIRKSLGVDAETLAKKKKLAASQSSLLADILGA